MKKRKNIMAKTVAFIALFSIVIGVVGTGLLVVISSPGYDEEITQEQLQEYLDSLSGAIITGSGETQEIDISGLE